MAESPLTGGRSTEGVVRIGDTVRRPASDNSTFVQSLLAHLENAGFEGAPRHLGTDEQDRDIYSFIPGDVPDELGWHEDRVLAAAAGLIRRFHDVTAGFEGNDPVICHHDLSPCNFVFRDGVPIAIIDFDTAAPGNRDDDLGYAAWLWLDLGNDAISFDEQRRRLAIFRAAYGEEMDRAVLERSILKRQHLLAASTIDRDTKEWANRCRDWTSRLLSETQKP